MRFNAPDELARAIKNAGISFVSLANNHILDRGVKGLNNTIKTLDLLGLEHSGTYKTKEDSERIFTKTIKGVRIAFISCTYGVNQGLRCSFLPDDDLWKVDILKYPDVQITTKSFLIKRFISNLIPYSLKKRMRRKRKMTFMSVPDSVALEEFELEKNKLYLRRILDKIKRAKSISDFVIVLPHIGGQYCTEPGPWQRKITESFISAGADLIISNHCYPAYGIAMINRNIKV